MAAKFEVYKDGKNECRWRLRTGNGQVIATGGEGDSTRAKALGGVKAGQRDAPGAGGVAGWGPQPPPPSTRDPSAAAEGPRRLPPSQCSPVASWADAVRPQLQHRLVRYGPREADRGRPVRGGVRLRVVLPAGTHGAASRGAGGRVRDPSGHADRGPSGMPDVRGGVDEPGRARNGGSPSAPPPASGAGGTGGHPRRPFPRPGGAACER